MEDAVISEFKRWCLLHPELGMMWPPGHVNEHQFIADLRLYMKPRVDAAIYCLHGWRSDEDHQEWAFARQRVVDQVSIVAKKLREDARRGGRIPSGYRHLAMNDPFVESFKDVQLYVDAVRIV
jgi:hypothetical protein